MSMIPTLLDKIYSHQNFPTNIDRRAILTTVMDDLKPKEINCFSCDGKCCTFISNSMQVDLIQAIELYRYLDDNNRISDQLISDLEENTKQYRLDYEINAGGRRSVRRYYTCPFYKLGSKGCSIAPEFKPYGCLAFNPTICQADGGKSCSSDISILEKREELFSTEELKINELIAKELGIFWQKKPIAPALLEIYNALNK
jgi:Fe-S-cluster containining protein